MKKNNITSDYAKETGLTIALILIIIAYFSKRDFLLPPAVLLMLISILIPSVLKPVGYLWQSIAVIIGKFMSFILLGFLFFAFVTTVGKIRKMMGSDPMKLKLWKKGKESVLTVRDITYTKKDIEHPY